MSAEHPSPDDVIIRLTHEQATDLHSFTRQPDFLGRQGDLRSIYEAMNSQIASQTTAFISAAERLVIEDVRRSWPEATAKEALAQARDTIYVPEEEPAMGAVALSEDGSATAIAYRRVLEWDTHCEGHESLRGDLMGASDYCDGSCRLVLTASELADMNERNAAAEEAMATLRRESTDR